MDYHATPPLLAIGVIVIGLLQQAPLVLVDAQAATSISPTIGAGDLGTQILPPNDHIYGITGGTPIGANLYHSFAQFNVGTGDTAQFQTSTLIPNAEMHNILGRITDANPSIIFGTIDSATYYPNANLFLMNPAGFLFGPNATVNVGGMVAFTTADYLRLEGAGGNGIFYADTTQTSVLTSVPVAAFGFLGSNPAAIALQGSILTVAPGQSISLVGGSRGFDYTDPDTGLRAPASVPDGVTMTGGKLSASGGQINLASVASAGEILSSNLELGANVNGTSFTSLGGITISRDAHIDTTGTTGGTIAIRGGQLTIRDGAMIATAASSDHPASAGSVTISGASVQITGSDVVIKGTNVSVTISKVTAVNLDGSGGTIAVTAGSAGQPGNVAVAQSALLDASGTSGGSITIRGGQLAIADATLSADTIDSPGAQTALDINLTGDLLISNTHGLPAMTARTTGGGAAGAIEINSANLVATSASPAPIPFTLIDTHTSGAGRAGDINITTGNLEASYQEQGIVWFTDSGTAGLEHGHGGNVTISAQSVTLEKMNITTGDTQATLLNQDANGSAGNVTIKGNGTDNAERLMLSNSVIDTGALAAFDSAEEAGSVTLNASQINLTQSVVTALGFGGGGAFSVTADSLIMVGHTQLESLTASGTGGGILVNAGVVELLDGSTMATTIVGEGQAGDIQVTATDHLTLSTSPFDTNPSGFFSNSTGEVGDGNGHAGAIVVTTPKLDMIGGSRINTITLGSGSGGDVTINSTNSVSISGTFPSADPEPLFGVGTIHPSGIFTGTAVGDVPCSDTCGPAGRISITTGSLVLGNGAQIDSGTSNNGRGGDITIQAVNSISMSGTLTDGSPVGVFSRTIGADPGSGPGGNIALTAGQSVTISAGASVSASSTGPGDTGNIQIGAGNLFAMTNSSVTTQANHASGGTIKITTNPSGTVDLSNSLISASVLNGAGGGGSVNIDPLYVLLQNSQILAQAVQGPGGNITINITNGGLFLPDANSVISASSQFGVNGTVTIQSPNAPVSGQIQPLGKTPLIATSLLNQHCAALAGGEFSSFTVAGRDSLPTEPGGWLTSPLALGLAEDGGGTVPEKGVRAGIDDAPARETTILSLRQIAPVGFLTQTFAVDQSTSCRS